MTRANVVINLVGPYWKWGTPVVQSVVLRYYHLPIPHPNAHYIFSAHVLNMVSTTWTSLASRTGSRRSSTSACYPLSLSTLLDLFSYRQIRLLCN